MIEPARAICLYVMVLEHHVRCHALRSRAWEGEGHQTITLQNELGIRWPIPRHRADWYAGVSPRSFRGTMRDSTMWSPWIISNWRWWTIMASNSRLSDPWQRRSYPDLLGEGFPHCIMYLFEYIYDFPWAVGLFSITGWLVLVLQVCCNQ